MTDLISRAAAIKEIDPIRYSGDFVSTLIHLPAVDAVPVTWLKKMRDDDRLTIDDVETIDLILAWWQKEQEAR